MRRLLLSALCIVCTSCIAWTGLAASEDDCIAAQERLKSAKEEAATAAEEYSVCLHAHDNSDDCSVEKDAVDTAHDEVEDAQTNASIECE